MAGRCGAVLIAFFCLTLTAHAKSKQVVATLAPVVDMVSRLGGDRVTVHGLTPYGTHPHSDGPNPSDLKPIRSADLILMNGLGLDLKMEKLTQVMSKNGATILKLGDAAARPEEWIFSQNYSQSAGFPNPHLWLSVGYAMKYTELIRDALIKTDPKYKEVYLQNTKKYLATLNRLDQTIMKAMASLPEGANKLLTYHDAWVYFCARYHCNVVGVVQLPDLSEPHPSQSGALVHQIQRENLRAIFGSDVFPSLTLIQVGLWAGISSRFVLWDDTLPGVPGAAEHSYVGMMLKNVKTLVGALGGDPTILAHFKE